MSSLGGGSASVERKDGRAFFSEKIMVVQVVGNGGTYLVKRRAFPGLMIGQAGQQRRWTLVAGTSREGMPFGGFRGAPRPTMKASASAPGPWAAVSSGLRRTRTTKLKLG